MKPLPRAVWGATDAAIIKRLEDDPGDDLAAALARLGRTMQARIPQ